MRFRDQGKREDRNKALLEDLPGRRLAGAVQEIHVRAEAPGRSAASAAIQDYAEWREEVFKRFPPEAGLPHVSVRLRTAIR